MTTGQRTWFLFLILLLQASLVLTTFSANYLNSQMNRGEALLFHHDYSNLNLYAFGTFDLVVSVISIHHQETDDDKRELFKNIYHALQEGGIFLFGDLMTCRDPHKAALNDAMHYHHLVNHAADEKTLTEWAHHHKFLNCLAPYESQMDWLKEAGFQHVDILFRQWNTFLLYAKK